MDLLSQRVGPTGHVLGLDRDPENLDAARRLTAHLGNVDFVDAGILDNDLPDDSFDFVHIRFVLTIVGQNEAMIAAAARLVKPGGILALEEGDGSGINCFPPNEAFIKLRNSLFTVFGEVGDPMAGRRTFGQLRRAGFEDVNFRPCRAGARSTDDMAMYLPETIGSVREALLARAIFTVEELADNLAACEAHLRDPDTISTHIGVFQVWGRKPV
jgi:SAM-dependent methyltransferase